MVRRFEEQVWDLVTRAGGRVVKLIGDEAMFVVEDVARACDVGLAFVEASPHPVRVGLACGPVVGLYGDYYGETVNLAARLVRAATPSTLVVSESVRERMQVRGSVIDVAFRCDEKEPAWNSRLLVREWAGPVPIPSSSPWSDCWTRRVTT